MSLLLISKCAADFRSKEIIRYKFDSWWNTAALNNVQHLLNQKPRVTSLKTTHLHHFINTSFSILLLTLKQT